MPSSCPVGKIRRKGYSRKSYIRRSGSRVSRAQVPSTCVPDKGKPGKTPLSRQILPKPTKHVLSPFGYATHKSTELRHKALRMASRQYKPLEVLRHLNLIRNFQADPNAKRIMSEDLQYMSKLYASMRNIARSSARKKSKKSRKSSKKSRK